MLTTRPTIHVIAPFHSRLLKEHWSHCAFTQVALRQIKIFKALGCKVIDYSNWGSESEAFEHVELLSKRQFNKLYVDDGLPGHGNKAEIGSPGWQTWFAQLFVAIKQRVKTPGKHIILHTFGDAAGRLVKELPTGDVQHLEGQIGYDRGPFGAHRAYISDTWRHYLWGKYGSETGERRYSWVVPPFYDEADWPFVPQDAHLEPAVAKPYIAFMGRVTEDKGIHTILSLAKVRPDWYFKLAGSGDIRPFGTLPSNVEYLGVLPGNKRAAFLGSAAVHIAPTDYIEPCAGNVCEGMLMGTPAVGSNWGGFSETLQLPGGMRVSTLQEWIDAIEQAKHIPRSEVATYARSRFTLSVAAQKYARIAEQLLSFYGRGWYELRG